MGGAYQELPLDPARHPGRRRGDPDRRLRQCVPRLLAGDGCPLHRGATPGLQGRRPRLPLEAEAAHPGYLREPRQPARLRPVPRHVPVLQRRGACPVGGPGTRPGAHQGPGPRGREPALLPAPDLDATVQHRHREGVQRPRRRQREARQVGRIPRHAPGHPRPQRRPPVASLERPRRGRRLPVRRRLRPLPAAGTRHGGGAGALARGPRPRPGGGRRRLEGRRGRPGRRPHTPRSRAGCGISASRSASASG